MCGPSHKLATIIKSQWMLGGYWQQQYHLIHTSGYVWTDCSLTWLMVMFSGGVRAKDKFVSRFAARHMLFTHSCPTSKSFPTALHCGVSLLCTSCDSQRSLLSSSSLCYCSPAQGHVGRPLCHWACPGIVVCVWTWIDTLMKIIWGKLRIHTQTVSNSFF